jgi:hypothetical protein
MIGPCAGKYVVRRTRRGERGEEEAVGGEQEKEAC